MIEITTNRLTLIPLDYRLLSIWYLEGRRQMEIELGLNENHWVMDEQYHLETTIALETFWMKYTNLYPKNYYWYTNWEIILTNEKIAIGSIGFGGYPEAGHTSIGYIINENFQKKGYASEALDGILNWAFQNQNLEIVHADTPKTNLPSQKVLTKNCFICTGEGMADSIEIIPVFHWEKQRQT